MTASLQAPDRSSAELDHELRKATRGARGSDYAELSRRVKAAGLMERRRGFYLAVGLVDALALIGCWAAVVANRSANTSAICRCCCRRVLSSKV